MATITTRKRIDGTIGYRVRFRKKGLKDLSLTFDTKEEAIIWALDHEDKFAENPEYYYKKANELKKICRYARTRKKQNVDF